MLEITSERRGMAKKYPRRSSFRFKYSILVEDALQGSGGGGQGRGAEGKRLVEKRQWNKNESFSESFGKYRPSDRRSHHHHPFSRPRPYLHLARGEKQRTQRPPPLVCPTLYSVSGVSVHRKENNSTKFAYVKFQEISRVLFPGWDQFHTVP